MRALGSRRPIRDPELPYAAVVPRTAVGADPVPVRDVEVPGLGRIRLRKLRPDEGPQLAEAIRSAYGDSYPVEWVYDADETRRLITEGLVESVVAEDAQGALVCHVATTFELPDDPVGHSGQAVSLPAVRGHHVFVEVKRYQVDLARIEGLAGLYCEATTAHPYSQRANLDAGGLETGFLLGFITEQTQNNAAIEDAQGRQSAALFYIHTTSRDLRPAYPPERHRAIVESVVEACRLAAEVLDPPQGVEVPARSVFSVEKEVGNVAVATVQLPGRDLAKAIGEERRRLFAAGVDALYVDLPLDIPATALVADDLEVHGATFAGVLPHRRARGDVLRLQSLNGRKRLAPHIDVASPHGQRLLDYVVSDMSLAGHEVAVAVDEKRQVPAAK
jgi:hypothetical protein